MIDFRNLETFLWVVRLASFRRAAERLNTTQPAVSARISVLEDTLGLRLLDRRPRRVEPTGAGAALLGYAERILALRDEMVEMVANTVALHGTLRLGVPETIVHTWLGRLVERLAADFPAVTLDVEVDSTPNLREAVSAGRLDLVFLHAPAPDDRLTTSPLCSFPLGWFASPRLGLSPETTSLAACATRPIITFRRGSPPYAAVRRLLAAAGLPKARMFGSSAIAGTVRLALDGVGVCVLPVQVVQRELREGSLVALRISDPLPPIEFHVGYCRIPASRLTVLVAERALAVARAFTRDEAKPSKVSIKRIQKGD